MSEEVKFVKDNERLEHVTIGVGNWRNFRGERTENNKSGARKFNIFLPPDVADYLADVGWYVRTRDPYREGDDPTYFLEIEASYDTKGGQFAPPEITMVTYDGRETHLTEENVGLLDKSDIEDAELEIRPYNWNVNGKRGCKAFLVELTVHLRKPRRALNANLRRDEEEE